MPGAPPAPSCRRDHPPHASHLICHPCGPSAGPLLGTGPAPASSHRPAWAAPSNKGTLSSTVLCVPCPGLCAGWEGWGCGHCSLLNENSALACQCPILKYAHLLHVFSPLPCPCTGVPCTKTQILAQDHLAGWGRAGLESRFFWPQSEQNVRSPLQRHLQALPAPYVMSLPLRQGGDTPVTLHSHFCTQPPPPPPRKPYPCPPPILHRPPIPGPGSLP